MNIRNRENQQCYRCKKPTMTYYPKEEKLKCASCDFEINHLDDETISLDFDYTKLFGENGSMWILYISKNFLKSHKHTKMYENIPMNIFSMELIKKEKEFSKEILNINYEETKTEESLKDFKLFFWSKKLKKKWGYINFMNLHLYTISL